jgi:hypothetical protein
MLQSVLLTFLAGVFVANGTPHFVKGVTRERFPTVFGGGPVVNLLAGWTMLVLVAPALLWAHPERHPAAALTAGAAGALAMGLFHAAHGAFGDAGDERREVPGAR